MLNIRKFQCLVGDSDLAGIYVDSNQVEANSVNESVVTNQPGLRIVNWLVYYQTVKTFL